MHLQHVSSAAINDSRVFLPCRALRWLVAGERELSEGIHERLAGGPILAPWIWPIEELYWITLC